MGHLLEPEVAGLRQERGVQVGHEVLGSALGATRMLEAFREPGLTVDLDDQIGELDPRQSLADLLLQSDGRCRAILRRMRGHDDGVLLETNHAVAARKDLVQPSKSNVKLLFLPCEEHGRVRGDPDHLADVASQGRPPVAGDQTGIELGISRLFFAQTLLARSSMRRLALR